MADSDNTVIGYNFFEQDTGMGRWIRVLYLPFRSVWDTLPTADDISGIDKSAAYLPKCKFDLGSPEDMHRGRIIQYTRNVLGRDVSPYVNDLPDDFVRQCLFNVVYDRPMSQPYLRLRMGDTLIVNPYALAPYYLTLWLLRSLANDLTSQPANSFVRNGELLNEIADHVQFAIDRILVKFNLSEPDASGMLIEGYTISSSTSKSTTLYVSETAYTEWANAGGDEVLLVAEYGLNNKVPDNDTIANKTQIMAAWETAQNPPAST